MESIFRGDNSVSFSLPDSLDLLVLLAESSLHFSTKSGEGGVSIRQLVLGVLEGVLGVAEGGRQVVALGGEGGIGGRQVVDSSVGILQSIVGFAKLVCRCQRTEAVL